MPISVLAVISKTCVVCTTSLLLTWSRMNSYHSRLNFAKSVCVTFLGKIHKSMDDGKLTGAFVDLSKAFDIAILHFWKNNSPRNYKEWTQLVLFNRSMRMKFNIALIQPTSIYWDPFYFLQHSNEVSSLMNHCKNLM